MGQPPKDRRDSLSQGYLLATRASSVALTAVVPAGIGYWLDQQWHTTPAMVIVGAVLGFIGMLSELMALSRPSRPKNRSTAPTDPSKP